MIHIDFKHLTINISVPTSPVSSIRNFLEKYGLGVVLVVLTGISIYFFKYFLDNGLGLAYNDARSHLDIGRRVVEGLKPGLAQLGSVWLPLPHLLMVPTVWNDFMWHTGLSGAIISMIAFVFTGVLIYKFLEKLKVGLLGRFVGVAIFVANLNILYLQSTAMTELLLIATMTAAVYELLCWFENDKLLNLLKAAFWIMLSTLNRYDGWFLFVFSIAIITLYLLKKKGYKATEGTIILFCSLGGLGIVLWMLWNLAIFGDPLFFAFGPYSARAQQMQLEEAGVLPTKGDWLFSMKVYLYALAYNSNAFISIVGAIGSIMLWFDKKIKTPLKIASSALLAPLLFNILALYLGHSVLYIQGLSGNTWFNVRYGIMMMPSIAIFIGYMISRLNSVKYVLIALMSFVIFFSFYGGDAVTIDDARVGSSQKNVTEVSGWLANNAGPKEGFILISAASHDAIIFSSGLPMSRFIHEGTGAYWETATLVPDKWARWIIMRTNDTNDSTFRLLQDKPGLKYYNKVGSYPFADIYELKPEYLDTLNTEPSLGKQK